MTDHHLHESVDPWEDEEPQRPSLLRKIVLVLLSIILIILLMSYVFVTFPVKDIILGKEDSVVLINGTRIDMKDVSLSIVFETKTYKILEKAYLNNQEYEFSACLQGFISNGTYYITSMYQPVMYTRSFASVRFQQCSNDTLIVLHSHPYLRCSASEQDIETWDRTKELNPDVLMVIMCDRERFSVYG